MPTAQQQVQHCYQSKIDQAARTAGRNWLIGEGVAAGVGGVVGGLVAGGFVVATETWPFAGQTIPSGIIAGGLTGASEALPYTSLGALGEFAIDAHGAVGECEGH